MTDIDVLEAVLHRRHSCRAFRPDPVPQADIERIVTAAARVPSWCNAQPWQVLVTRGPETERFRAALLETAMSAEPQPDMPWPESYPDAYGARRRECGFQLYDAVGIARADKPGRAAQTMRNYALFDAPHVAIIHAPKVLGPYGAMDTGGFVTAFTLAATALGIASIPQAAVAAFAPMIHAHFDIPEDRMILCAISFGYADEDHPANSFRTRRAPLSEVLDTRGDG